jgi:hypothetical protein
MFRRAKRSNTAAYSLGLLKLCVWSARHDRYSRCANGIGHPVSLRDHAGHRANPDQPDTLGEHETHSLGVAHRLRVAIDRQHFGPAGVSV